MSLWMLGALLAYVLIALALDFYWLYQKEHPANTHEPIRSHRNDAVALSQGPFKGSAHFKHERAISRERQPVSEDAMTLTEHIEQMKVKLAHCDDIDEATALYKECREALKEMIHLTDIAGDVTDKLSMRTIPKAWEPFIVARNERRH